MTTTLEQPPAHLVERCRRLVIDQHQALLSAVAVLHEEFGGQLARSTVQYYVYSAHARLAVQGVVPNFLPLLAERSARVFLGELVRARG